jgi:hypothetical protein
MYAVAVLDCFGINASSVVTGILHPIVMVPVVKMELNYQVYQFLVDCIMAYVGKTADLYFQVQLRLGNIHIPDQ